MKHSSAEFPVAGWCIVGALAALLLVYLGGFVAFRTMHRSTAISPGGLFYLLPDTAPNKVFAKLYQPLLWISGERILLLHT